MTDDSGKRHQRALVIDPVVAGLEHAPFNAELLTALHSSGVFDEVSFFADADHRRGVMETLSEPIARELSGAPIAIAKGIRKRLLDWKLVRLLVREACRDGTIVLFLSSNRCTIFSLALARLIGGARGRHAVHVFHAELSTLWWPRRRNPFKSALDLFTAFRVIAWAQDNIVVLEPGIREEFVRKYPDSASLALLWPHPVSPVLVEAPTMEEGVARIGFLGWTSIEKGFGRFLAVAGEVREVYGPRVSFRAIGHHEAGQLDDEAVGVLDERPRSKRWPRDEFLRAAMSLDFICLFYDERYYRYVASGILLDAIALTKPIIAPRIRLIEAIAEEHGEIGLTYGGGDDLAEVVKEAIEVVGTPRYRRMVENMKSAAEARSTRALAACIARDLALR